MKRNKRIPIIALALILLGSFCISWEARAEFDNNINPMQWLNSMGDVGFNSAGSVYLPGTVIGALGGNQYGAMDQFVMLNHVLNECVKNAIGAAPQSRESYTSALDTWNQATCRMQQCWQMGMVMSLSSTQGTGSGQDHLTALAIASAASDTDSCDGSDHDTFDPRMIQMLSGL